MILFIICIREQPCNRTQEITINISAQFCLLSVNVFFVFYKSKCAQHRPVVHDRAFYHSFYLFYQLLKLRQLTIYELLFVNKLSLFILMATAVSNSTFFNADGQYF